MKILTILLASKSIMVFGTCNFNIFSPWLRYDLHGLLHIYESRKDEKIRREIFWLYICSIFLSSFSFFTEKERCCIIGRFGLDDDDDDDDMR